MWVQNTSTVLRPITDRVHSGIIAINFVDSNKKKIF